MWMLWGFAADITTLPVYKWAEEERAGVEGVVGVDESYATIVRLPAAHGPLPSMPGRGREVMTQMQPDIIRRGSSGQPETEH